MRNIKISNNMAEYAWFAGLLLGILLTTLGAVYSAAWLVWVGLVVIMAGLGVHVYASSEDPQKKKR